MILETRILKSQQMVPSEQEYACLKHEATCLPEMVACSNKGIPYLSEEGPVFVLEKFKGNNFAQINPVIHTETSMLLKRLI